MHILFWETAQSARFHEHHATLGTTCHPPEHDTESPMTCADSSRQVSSAWPRPRIPNYCMTLNCSSVRVTGKFSRRMMRPRQAKEGRHGSPIGSLSNISRVSLMSSVSPASTSMLGGLGTVPLVNSPAVELCCLAALSLHIGVVFKRRWV